MIFETPVFDRTQVNVDNVKKGINDDKGAFLYTVANRIENNSKYISNLLTFYGYTTYVDTREWKREDIPNIDDINRMKNNLNILKKSFFVYKTTPNVNTNKTSINFTDVNNMEKILYDIEKLIVLLDKQYIYGGVFVSGQNRLWQQRFRRPRNWVNFEYETIEEIPDDLTLSSKIISEESPLFHSGIYDGLGATLNGLNETYKRIDNFMGGSDE